MPKELGHVHCGHVDGDYEDYRQHRGRMETEAEMTAYMVNRGRGMGKDSAEAFSPGYIASWSKGDPAVLAGAMTRATKAFNTIMDGPWPAGQNLSNTAGGSSAGSSRGLPYSRTWRMREMAESAGERQVVGWWAAWHQRWTACPTAANERREELAWRQLRIALVAMDRP